MLRFNKKSFARTVAQKRRLALEPLESRKLLTADTGLVYTEPLIELGPKVAGPPATLSVIANSNQAGSQLGSTADFENFDSVVAPALSAGWTATSTSTNSFVTDDSLSDTAPNGVFVEDISTISDVRLTSPVIAVTIDNARLSFANSYDTESNFDGGVLEISINGGDFQDIVDAGGIFISGGYNSSISGGFSSPIASRGAWSGNSGGYVTTVVDLPLAALGNDVQLRWRFGSDSSVSGNFWAIDTIRLSEAPAPPSDDFGDAPAPYPTLASENGARHTVGSLFLGQLVDTEADGIHTTAAVGDGSDEDGVQFSGPRDPGTDLSVTVSASEAGGRLNGWVDWNQDGDWLDAGEQIFSDQSLSAGSTSFTVPIPAGAAIGDAIARFRLSTDVGLSFDGPATDGEVEDYSLQIGERRLNWVNRGEANDRFDETFGSDAELARGVVDAVFASWERVINDLNHDFFGGPGRIDITVSFAATGTGFGASAGANFSNGFPTTGVVTISRGNDTDGDGNGDGAGFFLDPTPLDHSEFLGSVAGGAFIGFAQSGSPAQGRSDLFTLVNAEITHSVGLFAGSARINNPINGTVTDTGVTDDSEGGGVGRYFVFDGPSVTHLMTSNNGGSNGSDFNAIVHTAGRPNGAPNQPLTFDSDFRGTRDLVGADGPGNAIYSFGQRTLVNDVLALVFQDAYGYDITLPQTFGTTYSVFNESTGLLTLRGGIGGSDDVFNVSVDGDELVVSVDIGNDVAGTGPNGDDSDIAAFVSRFPLNQVNSISVLAGDGNDQIELAPLAGISVTIDGSSPTTDSGDSLTVLTEGVTGSNLIDNGNGSGSFASDGNGLINWIGIEQLDIEIPPPAPQVQSVVINDGDTQRSSLTVSPLPLTLSLTLTIQRGIRLPSTTQRRAFRLPTRFRHPTRPDRPS